MRSRGGRPPRSRSRRIIGYTALLALLALGSQEVTPGNSGDNAGEDRWHFRLRLVAPAPQVQRETTQPEGAAAIAIPTFDRLGPGMEAGAHRALPFKVVRIAIPEGGEVSLQVTRARPQPWTRGGLGPGPEAASGFAAPTAEPLAGTESGPIAPEGNGTAWRPVRLGETGYFRFQKFVEVIYEPLRRAPGAEEAYEFYSEVEADLLVADVDWGVVEAEALEVRPDPQFESEYRAAFLNYDEGRRFRSPRPRGPGRAGHPLAEPWLASTDASTQSVPASAATQPATSGPGASLATTPVYRVVVKTDGVYRMTQAQIATSAPGLLLVDPRTLKMTNKGIEVPVRIRGESDGSFGPGDYLEFYGQGMLGEPELVLNHDEPSPLVSDIFQANDFTDENVYFVFGTSEPGPRARIQDLPAAVIGGLPVANSFQETIRREFDQRHIPDGVNDPFIQWPLLTGNNGTFSPSDPNAPNCGFTNNGIHTLAQRYGPASSPGSVACAACDLALVDLDPSAAASPATVRVSMRGTSSDMASPDHMTTVQVGTTASQSSTRCWDGETQVTQSVTVSQSALSGGTGVFIAQPGLAAANIEGLGLDWIEVDYRRLLNLQSGTLGARLPNVSSTFHLTGFTAMGPDDFAVYELSRSAGAGLPEPRRITGGTVGGGAGNFTLDFSLQVDGTLQPGAARPLIAAGQNGFRTPLRVEEVDGEDLTDTTHEADMIVITTPQAVGEPAAAAFSDYITHRAADSGLVLKVVMMQDVYDGFSYGLETPEALRSFLAYAFDNWQGPSSNAAPPAYVMLVGDSSLDYKNNTNDGNWINQIPTFIMYKADAILDYYSSDTYIAAFRGTDQLPDVHLGRITVRSPAETSDVFQKMLDYDALATNTPAVSWRAHGLLMADEGKDVIESDMFESVQTAIGNTYFVPPFTHEKLFYRDPNHGNGTNQADWRSDYVAAADAGAAVSSFFGHGAFDDWGNEGLFNSGHVPLMSATGRPTFSINENCLIGGFHVLGGDALSETFLKAQNKAAVAVFAPAGLTVSNIHETINSALYPAMFGLEKERRFGNLMTRVKLAIVASTADLQHYSLLGDPAQRLTLPAPRPPTSFTATGGLNAAVVLDWTPGPDAGSGARVRIYRTDAQSGGAYTLLNPAGATGTSYTDTAVVNGRAYFYRAVSVDLSGPFEGAVTNLNSTCNLTMPEASGTDCRWAKPLNPNPPSPPLGFRVTNPGMGDRLGASWAASSEPDLMKFTVHFGTSVGGPYPMAVDFPPNVTSGQILGLTPGITYYLVLTATNTSDRISAHSLEASGLPSLFEGINPPDVIDDLDARRLAPASSSIELIWTPPPIDIYGGAVTLASFSIYRDIVPAFVPGPENLLVTIDNPSAGSYIDAGAYSAAPNYFYLVKATDDQGFSSGVGRQVPKGIGDLQVARSGSNLIFTWTQPAVDMDGIPTMVSHYELFADAQPLDRARTEALTPALSFIAATTASLPIPPGAIQYFTVIVVDIRGNKSPF